MLLSILNTQPKNNFIYLGKFVYETSFKIGNFFRCYISPQKALDFGIFLDFGFLDKGCSISLWATRPLQFLSPTMCSSWLTLG